MTPTIPDELSKLLRGRVLVITGSGVSAESGIPTFRGSDGYWRKMDPTKLATQTAFDSDGQLVWEWYGERRRHIREAEPNAAHLAVARLHEVAREYLIVTQNVDDLHERAGTPADHLVHIHGEIFLSRCTDARCGYTTREDHPVAPLPSCPRCGARLRPAVIWFDELLDGHEVSRVGRFFAKDTVDLVLIIGTTAVFPYIIDWATREGSLVEINPEPTTISPHARWIYRMRATEALAHLIPA
jgi:NAD-dependent deacetylase